DARAFRRVELAQNESFERTLFQDHAGSFDFGRNVGDAADDAIRAGDAAENRFLFDPVLKTDDRRAFPDEGKRAAHCAFEVPELDAGDDDVDGADAGGVVRRPNALETDVALRTFQSQALALH